MPASNAHTPFIIRDIITETPISKSFVLEQVSGNPFPLKAGQYLTFAFEKPYGEERRSYSLSSAPALNEPCTITVKRVQNGEFSRRFIDHARKGDVLYCSGYGGFFTLPDDMAAYKQIFFLAAGSGIVPVFSLIKTLRQQHPDIRLVLIYSNKSAADTIFYEALLRLAEQSQGRLIIDFLFSSSNNLLKARLNNSLLGSMLLQHNRFTLEETLSYICGPFEYMDTVTITLLTEGLPKENIRRENFAAIKPQLKVEPEDQDKHTVSIRYADHVATMQVQYPVSILQQAKKDGISLPYSCESGQCGSCTVRCTKGKVWMSYNEVLTDKELDQGLVLTCTGFPVEGDIELEV